MEVRVLSPSSIQVKVDRNLYSSEVIHKCFYWYGDKYSVEIKLEGDLFIIYITELTIEGLIAQLINKIKNDLIDFKTREIISKETKNIREILIAKAFAHGDELEETPPGDINDPVGFNPSKS